jgi:CubicO group peptidase (beta-lactamase class C family)
MRSNMRRVRFFHLFVLSISVWLSANVDGQDSGLVEQTETFLKKATSDETSGVAILVAREGKVLLQTAAGMANIEKKIPVTTETIFRIGSISKQFTAMAILRLAEQGKLSLKDPLAKFYPDFPNAGEITLEHLMTHTSGLQSYTEKPGFMLRVAKPVEPSTLLNWCQSDSPVFSPGQKFAYCNTGYFLLGEIIAAVSGKSYADFLRDEFFVPLEMNNTGIFVNAHAPEPCANGYSLLGDAFDPALDWDMSWAGGAGAMYSTVSDLFRWNEALYDGEVIGAEMLQKAITPFELPAGADGMNYGYGLFAAEYKRLPMISHSGGLNGWSADLAYFPEQKCTIAVLTNGMPSKPELTPKFIFQKLADLVLAQELKQLPQREVDTSIDPKTFIDYVGKYDYQGSVARIFVAQDGLYAQLTDQPKNQIFPKAKDEFFWKVVDAEVKFKRNQDGKVVGAQHTQNGLTFSAPRIQETELSEAALDSLVGKYRYGAAVMTTTREGDQLYAQITGQPKFPIFPINETTFKWRVVDAEVEFVKDEKGEVTHVQHTQGGTTFDAQRIKDKRAEKSESSR